MRRLAIALVLVMSCSGGSNVPAAVQEDLNATEAAFLAQEPHEVCGKLAGLQNSFYEWLEFARGNQPPMVMALLEGLDMVRINCPSSRDPNANEPDIKALETSYGAWKKQLQTLTKSKSSYGKIMFWLFGSMVVGGFLMYARRKFREA